MLRATSVNWKKYQMVRIATQLTWKYDVYWKANIVWPDGTYLSSSAHNILAIYSVLVQFDLLQKQTLISCIKIFMFEPLDLGLNIKQLKTSFRILGNLEKFQY